MVENVFDLEEFDSALDDLEIRLEQLHLRFERFFSGAERTRPEDLREEIDQQFAALLLSQHNLGPLARVRLTIVHQRYESYQQCWERLAGRASSSLPPRLPSSLTPPLGTPSSPPLATAPPNEPAPRVERAPSPRPDSARTIRDFKQPFGSDSAQTLLDLHPPFENPSGERKLEKTPARSPLPFAVDTSSTTPYLRLPDEHELTGESAPGAAEESLERAREIHARLRATNTRPPSVERLAERLSETEAKLKALHGDRPITFDVVLRDDGKAFVKPIVH